MSENNEFNERRENVESKGAYAYDLHQAIRDTRAAIGAGDWYEASKRLDSLYDVCAPEIRESISAGWAELDRWFAPAFEKINRMDIKIRGRVPSERNYSYEEVMEKMKAGKRAELKWPVWGRLIRARFRTVIDCLDNHGELRKWREVEYGKV